MDKNFDCKTEYQRWLKSVTDKPLKKQILALSDSCIAEAFCGIPDFGTGGIRAVMGVGSNRLNAVTIKKIAKGTVDWLLSHNNYGKDNNKDNKDINKDKIISENCRSIADGCKRKTVVENSLKAVISFDSRKNSHKYAKLCAAIFAQFGIKVIVTLRPSPTPLLSFLVKNLSADAGVMITASHNPKEYNGYKLYGSHGGQLTDIAAKQAAGFIAAADPFEFETDNFDYHVKQKNITVTDASKDYLDAVVKSVAFGSTKDLNADKIKVVYTALNGVGGRLVNKLLSPFCHFYCVESQNKPDGSFAACDSINPENSSAFTAALKYATAVDADLILATDPDADRIGAMVKHKGQYSFLSGNQIGVLFADYLLSQNKSSSSEATSPIIIRSLVSSPMVDVVARWYGAEVLKVPTGFKYIGQEINILEQSGLSQRFLLGFEESHGFLCGTHASDKDGLQAALLLTKMQTLFKNQNKTLIDALEELSKKAGYFDSLTLSFKPKDKNGVQTISKLMQTFRQDGLCKQRVESKTDYLLDTKYPSDMIEFVLEDARIIVRPSGTEPLIKFYITAVASSQQSAQKILEKYQAILSKEIFYFY